MPKHEHSEELKAAAKQFLIDCFAQSNDYIEDKDLLVTTAMCIVEERSFFEDKEIYFSKRN